MKLLIVDDSEMMREIIKQTVETNIPGKEITFFEAENGQIALDILKNNTVELVFLDWSMPVLDGLTFVQDVRGRGIVTPIIMITSLTDEDKIMAAGMAGVNSYIEKPIKGGRLWEQIREFIE
ncbi:MAG: response regulator [Spirochaetota bacterium]